MGKNKREGRGGKRKGGEGKQSRRGERRGRDLAIFNKQEEVELIHNVTLVSGVPLFKKTRSTPTVPEGCHVV